MKALPSDTPIINILHNTAKKSTICKKYLSCFVIMLSTRAGLDKRDQVYPYVMSCRFQI